MYTYVCMYHHLLPWSFFSVCLFVTEVFVFLLVLLLLLLCVFLDFLSFFSFLNLFFLIFVLNFVFLMAENIRDHQNDFRTRTTTLDAFFLCPFVAVTLDDDSITKQIGTMSLFTYTYVSLHIPTNTYVYLRINLSTYVYLFLPTYVYIYLCTKCH